MLRSTPKITGNTKNGRMPPITVSIPDITSATPISRGVPGSRPIIAQNLTLIRWCRELRTNGSMWDAEIQYSNYAQVLQIKSHTPEDIPFYYTSISNTLLAVTPRSCLDLVTRFNELELYMQPRSPEYYILCTTTPYLVSDKCAANFNLRLSNEVGRCRFLGRR